jgi:heptosyltransferase II
VSLSGSDKIYIRGADWVGALVMATPVYRAVRRNFPSAHISVCVRPWSRGLLENCPYVDRIIDYNPSTFFDKARFIGALRAEKYDMALLLSHSFESAFMCLAAGIKVRAGYPYESRGFMLTHKTRDDRGLHRGRSLLKILEGVGMTVDDEGPELWLSRQDGAFADGIFEKNGIHSGDKAIGISFEVKGDPSRRWDERNFIELSKRLLNASPGHRLVVFGSGGDIEATRAMTARINGGGRVTDLSGKTTLTQFSACAKKCDVFISTDSGGAHVAAAAGTKVVVLFGPADPGRLAPQGKNVAVIRKKVDCAPCDLSGKMKYCRDNRCMQAITVDEVYAAVMEQLTGVKGVR